MSNYPMTRLEVEKLTGCKTSKRQLEVLRRMGLNPWSHPETGEVIIYYDAIVMNQANESEVGFKMNLDG